MGALRKAALMGLLPVNPLVFAESKNSAISSPGTPRRSHLLSPFISRRCTWWVRRSRSAPVRRSDRNTDGRPFLKGQVRGHHRRAALVALREHFEQKLSPNLRQRHVAEFVDNQEPHGPELTLQLEQPLLVASFHQLMRKSVRREEQRREAPLTRRQAKRQSNVALARARIAKRDHILPGQDVLASGEVQNKHLVQARDGRKIEAVQALHGREPRLADPPLGHPPLALQQLELRQPEQIAGMIDALARALARHLLVLVQERWQLQLLEMMSQQNLGGAGHDAGRKRGLHAALPERRIV